MRNALGEDVYEGYMINDARVILYGAEENYIDDIDIRTIREADIIRRLYPHVRIVARSVCGADSAEGIHAYISAHILKLAVVLFMKGI